MASIEEQIKKIVARKAKLANGKTIEQNLMEAVDFLYMCIQNRIDEMYDNYTPTHYQRRPFHDSLRSALYVEDFLNARIADNKIEISLKFNNNVWAWNFSHTHKSNVAVLMNEGWSWRSQPKNPIWRFTYFEGEHFIQNGIADFNRSNKWGIKVTWNIDNSNWY